MAGLKSIFQHFPSLAFVGIRTYVHICMYVCAFGALFLFGQQQAFMG